MKKRTKKKMAKYELEKEYARYKYLAEAKAREVRSLRSGMQAMEETFDAKLKALTIYYGAILKKLGRESLYISDKTIREVNVSDVLVTREETEAGNGIVFTYKGA